jgi:hypothetical protein
LTLVRAAEMRFFADHGHYGHLSALGPKQANLIPQEVAESGAKRGYMYKLKLTSTGYEFTAEPAYFDGGGLASYFCDETGVIRWSLGHPTRLSPPISRNP